ICVIASNACGSNTQVCKVLTAVPDVPSAITGPTGVCKKSALQGTQYQYSISLVPGATSYTWAVPAGAKIVTGQGTTVAKISFGSKAGTITVKAVKACGSSATSSISVNFIN